MTKNHMYSQFSKTSRIGQPYACTCSVFVDTKKYRFQIIMLVEELAGLYAQGRYYTHLRSGLASF